MTIIFNLEEPALKESLSIVKDAYYEEDEDYLYCVLRQYGAEILACRIANIPYAVVNNNYMVIDSNCMPRGEIDIKIPHVKRCGANALSKLTNSPLNSDDKIAYWPNYVNHDFLKRNVQIITDKEEIIRFVQEKKKTKTPYFIKALKKGSQKDIMLGRFSSRVIDFVGNVLDYNDSDGFFGSYDDCEAIDGCFGYMNIPSEVIVSDVVNFVDEWRIYVINGKIINCSRYEDYKSNIMPKEALEFAKQVVNNTTFKNTYVMDIGTSNTSVDNTNVWSIVEFNEIEASGRYLDNEPFAILKELEELI